MLEKLIFEKSSPGRTAYSLPECDVPIKPIEELIPKRSMRSSAALLRIDRLGISSSNGLCEVKQQNFLK
jgi:hypothetical protein